MLPPSLLLLLWLVLPLLLLLADTTTTFRHSKLERSLKPQRPRIRVLAEGGGRCLRSERLCDNGFHVPPESWVYLITRSQHVFSCTTRVIGILYDIFAVSVFVYHPSHVFAKGNWRFKSSEEPRGAQTEAKRDPWKVRAGAREPWEPPSRQSCGQEGLQVCCRGFHVPFQSCMR